MPCSGSKQNFPLQLVFSPELYRFLVPKLPSERSQSLLLQSPRPAPLLNAMCGRLVPCFPPHRPVQSRTTRSRAAYSWLLRVFETRKSGIEQKLVGSHYYYNHHPSISVYDLYFISSWEWKSVLTLHLHRGSSSAHTPSWQSCRRLGLEHQRKRWLWK